MKGNRLDQILAQRRRDVAADRERISEDEMARRAARRPRNDRRDFAAAMERGAFPRIIAEIKRASPSRGLLAVDLDPAVMARRYAEGGAAALSVLTEPHGFRGSLADLHAARDAVSLPVLRKDFLFCRYQVVESAANGADAILLIVRILSDERLADLLACAAEHQLAALVEIHGEDDLVRACRCGARLIGINNRDLASFETDGSRSCRLARRVPSGCRVVAASGIHGRADVLANREAGVECFLVGEALVRSPDPVAALKALRGV